MSALLYLGYGTTPTTISTTLSTPLTVDYYNDRKTILNSVKTTLLNGSTVEDVLGYYKIIEVRVRTSDVQNPTTRAFLDAFMRAKHRWAYITVGGVAGNYSASSYYLKSVLTGDEYTMSVESMLSSGLMLQSEAML